MIDRTKVTSQPSIDYRWQQLESKAPTTRSTSASLPRSVCRVLVEQHVLPATIAKLDVVPFEEFVVAVGLDTILIDECPIGTTKIHQIRPHLL